MIRLQDFPTQWDVKKAQAWLDKAEKMGVRAVEIALTRFDGGSAGSVGISYDGGTGITAGFLEEWLCLKDKEMERARGAQERRNLYIAVGVPLIGILLQFGLKFLEPNAVAVIPAEQPTISEVIVPWPNTW